MFFTNHNLAFQILDNSLVYKWRWMYLFNVRRLVHKVGPPMIDIWQRNFKIPKSFYDSPFPVSVYVDKLLTPLPKLSSLGIIACRFSVTF
jgi:hypothetical protein